MSRALHPQHVKIRYVTCEVSIQGTATEKAARELLRQALDLMSMQFPEVIGFVIGDVNE